MSPIPNSPFTFSTGCLKSSLTMTCVLLLSCPYFSTMLYIFVIYIVLGLFHSTVGPSQLKIFSLIGFSTRVFESLNLTVWIVSFETPVSINIDIVFIVYTLCDCSQSGSTPSWIFPLKCLLQSHLGTWKSEFHL